jgi:hypothetical protein
VVVVVVEDVVVGSGELVVVEDGEEVVVEVPLEPVVEDVEVVVVVDDVELPEVVVVVDVGGDAGTWVETGTTPHGPFDPERCCTEKGFEGCPALVEPKPMIATKMHVAAPPRTSDPTATGRIAATSRSRAVSLRRRRSRSGVRCVRWANHEVSGAAA